MAGIIIGVVLIALGAVLAFVVRTRINNKNVEIQFMKTTTIAELTGVLKENEAQGLENYREYAELKGIAATDSPQKAPYSGQDVAYYDAEIYQVFEEVETYRGDSGTHQRVNRREDLMSSQKSTGNLVLKDAQTGDKAYIEMMEHGMQLDTVKSLDKFEPMNMMSQYSFFGSFQYSQRGSKTLGFRMVEKTIPLDQSLYVLGDAYLQGGRLNITKSADSKKPYIVSTKNEADLVHGNKVGATAALVFGIILAVAGVAVMIFVH
jgi:hypothetical protein